MRYRVRVTTRLRTARLGSWLCVSCLLVASPTMGQDSTIEKPQQIQIAGQQRPVVTFSMPRVEGEKETTTGRAELRSPITATPVTAIISLQDLPPPPGASDAGDRNDSGARKQPDFFPAPGTGGNSRGGRMRSSPFQDPQPEQDPTDATGSITPELQSQSHTPVAQQQQGNLGAPLQPSVLSAPGPAGQAPPTPVQPQSIQKPWTKDVEQMLSSLQNKSNYLRIQSTLHPDWITEIRFPLLRYTQQHELSLVEAIHTAIQFAPEIEILRTQVGIDQAEIVRQQANFDWNRFLNANWDEQNNPNGSNLEGVDRLETHAWLANAGLRRLNAFGGQLQLAQELGYNDSNSQIFTPANQASSALLLEYQQPLLQGAGLLVNESQINIAVANANVSQQDLVRGLQAHIMSVINAYWALVARRGEYIIQKRSYDRALAVAKVVANRQHLDVGPVQSARAEATLGARRRQVLNAEYAVVLAQEQLLRLVFGAQFQAKIDREVVPISSMIGPIREADITLETQVGLQNRPEVAQALQLIKRSSIEQGVAKNQLLPLLSLSLNMSNRGLQGNDGYLSAYTDQWDFGDPSYGVGLTYALPVGNRAAKANVRQAGLRIKQFQKEFERSISDVVLEVRNAAHNISLSGKQRRVSSQALELARKELDILEKRIILLLDENRAGPLYLDDLLQTQDRLANAELGFLDASSSYAIALFELQRANGSLLKSSPLPAEAAAAPSWTHRQGQAVAQNPVQQSDPRYVPQQHVPQQHVFQQHVRQQYQAAPRQALPAPAQPPQAWQLQSQANMPGHVPLQHQAPGQQLLQGQPVYPHTQAIQGVAPQFQSVPALQQQLHQQQLHQQLLQPNPSLQPSAPAHGFSTQPPAQTIPSSALPNTPQPGTWIPEEGMVVGQPTYSESVPAGPSAEPSQNLQMPTQAPQLPEAAPSQIENIPQPENNLLPETEPSIDSPSQPQGAQTGRDHVASQIPMFGTNSGGNIALVPSSKSGTKNNAEQRIAQAPVTRQTAGDWKQDDSAWSAKLNLPTVPHGANPFAPTARTASLTPPAEIERSQAPSASQPETQAVVR